MDHLGCNIDISEIIKTTCSNVDGNLLMSSLIILSSLVFYLSILPRVRHMVKSDSKGVENIFNILFGTCEMLLLMGSLYIVGMHYYKGALTTTMYIWLGIMGFLVIICWLWNLPEWLKFFKGIKKNIDKENDDDGTRDN